MTPEGRVKALIKRRIAAEFPGSYRFMPVQNGMGASALDFYFCINGWFVAIEAKRAGEKPTPRQETTGREILDAGGGAYVVSTPEELETVIQLIKINHPPR